jgi:malate dehydrogenase (oxaloacetate-decarboxylating)(NADP+)
MFTAAARALALLVPPAQLAAGCLFPPLARIREASLAIAVAVAEVAFEHGLATIERPDDLAAFLGREMYVPEYLPL